MEPQRLSPTSSVSGANGGNGPAAAKRRAMKVRFYRNGDRHYCGYQLAVSTERFRTFDALLNDLTEGPVCDRNVLPQGIRYLFTLAGQRVRGLQEMSDGAAYVCASFDQFKRIDYGGGRAAPAVRDARDSAAAVTTPRQRQPQQPQQPHQPQQMKPKIIAVLQGGGAARPRRSARYLLNSRTAKSFDRVMSDISQVVCLPTGAVRKLYTLEGKLVTCLEDLLGETGVFVAYGNEKINNADFVLDETDYKAVNAQTKSQLRSRVGPSTPAVGSAQGQQQRKPTTQRLRSSSPLAEDDAELNAELDASASINGSEAGVGVNGSGSAQFPDHHGNGDDHHNDAEALAAAKSPAGRSRDSVESDRLCDRMSGAALELGGDASLSGLSGQPPLAEELRMATVEDTEE